mmetsp:Transcript_34037/g.72382  ORF Transcript_34037/g.72382 Transcript_34037/m.72382 type:complete len:222 (+) Transcript_34037:420-1085(+)
MQRSHGGPQVPQTHRMGKHRKRQVSEGLCEDKPMVSRLWLAQRRELLRMGLPIELPGIDDDTAQGAALSGKELRGAVHHDISTVFNGPAKVRRRKSVVDDKGDPGPLGEIGEGTQIADDTAGICETLAEEETDRGVLQCRFNLPKVANVYKGTSPVELLNRLPKLREAAPVKLVGGYDSVPGLHEREESQNLRSMATGSARGTTAALHVGQALLENRHRGI